jgi:hypothetical protein
MMGADGDGRDDDAKVDNVTVMITIMTERWGLLRDAGERCGLSFGAGVRASG